MAIFAAAALALGLALNPTPMRPRKRSNRPVVRRRLRPVTADSALLALRGEMLHDFLVRAGTQSPAFTESRTIDAADGVRIGPASVDVDFLGSPIVRATVRNSSQRTIDLLVSVTLHDAHGRTAQASTYIEHIDPGTTRAIELFSPFALTPSSLTWSATQL